MSALTILSSSSVSLFYNLLLSWSLLRTYCHSFTPRFCRLLRYSSVCYSYSPTLISSTVHCHYSSIYFLVSSTLFLMWRLPTASLYSYSYFHSKLYFTTLFYFIFETFHTVLLYPPLLYSYPPYSSTPNLKSSILPLLWHLLLHSYS